MTQKITLKEAREQGKLDEFICQREKDAPGDQERLERAIAEAAKTPPKTSRTSRQSSRKDSPGD